MTLPLVFLAVLSIMAGWYSKVPDFLRPPHHSGASFAVADGRVDCRAAVRASSSPRRVLEGRTKRRARESRDTRQDLDLGREQRPPAPAVTQPRASNRFRKAGGFVAPPAYRVRNQNLRHTSCSALLRRNAAPGEVYPARRASEPAGRGEWRAPAIAHSRCEPAAVGAPPIVPAVGVLRDARDFGAERPAVAAVRRFALTARAARSESKSSSSLISSGMNTVSRRPAPVRHSSAAAAATAVSGCSRRDSSSEAHSGSPSRPGR